MYWEGKQTQPPSLTHNLSLIDNCSERKKIRQYVSDNPFSQAIKSMLFSVCLLIDTETKYQNNISMITNDYLNKFSHIKQGHNWLHFLLYPTALTACYFLLSDKTFFVILPFCL